MKKKKILAFLLTVALMCESVLPAYAVNSVSTSVEMITEATEGGTTEGTKQTNGDAVTQGRVTSIIKTDEDWLSASEAEEPNYILGREMTEEEIAAQKAMVSLLPPMEPVKLDSDDIYAGLDMVTFDEFEPRYDLRETNILTPVKNQNPWGTCWAFSTMALMESSLIRQGVAQQDSIDLSERHLAYFTGNTGYDALGNANGDSITPPYDTYYLESGGNIDTAAMRLMNWQGAAAEAEYPYSNSEVAPEAIAREKAQDVTAIAKDIYLVPTAGTSVEEEVRVVKSLIKEYGCVWWSYHHADQYVDYSTGAINCNDPGLGTNHAITIVGWDDEYSKVNFPENCRPQNDGAWIMRNSWGEEFADEGYFYISYEDAVLGEGNVAGVLVAAKAEEYDNNYFYGNGIFYSYYPECREVAQVFEAKSGADVELLKAVSFMLASSGESYEVQVYKNPQMSDGVVTNPQSGQAMFETPVRGETGYPGVYTVDVPEVMLEQGDLFSVVVTFTDEDGASVYIDGTYEEGYAQQYGISNSINETQAGQSFASFSSPTYWFDINDNGFSARLNALTKDVNYRIPILTYEISTASNFADMQINRLSWNKCTNADKYEIYRSDREDGTYEKIAEVEGDVQVYQDELSVEQWNTVYYYKVKALFSDAPSEESEVVQVVGSNKINMTEAVVVKAGTDNVLSWVFMDGADGYVIERKMSGEDTFSELARIAGNNILTYTDVLEGTEGAVEYRIRAHKNATLYSEWSDILTASGANIESIEMEFGSSLVHPGEEREYQIYKVIDGQRQIYGGEVWYSASNGSGLVYDVSEEGNVVKVTGSDGKEILRINNGKLEIVGDSKDCEVILTFHTGQYQGEAEIFILEPVNITEVTAQNAESIRISWSSKHEDVAYRVWRKAEGEAEYRQLTSDISQTTYTDNTVETGINYYYKIQMVKSGLATSLEMAKEKGGKTLPDKAVVIKTNYRLVTIENNVLYEYAVSLTNDKENAEYKSDTGAEINFENLQAGQKYYIFVRLKNNNTVYGETVEVTLPEKGALVFTKDIVSLEKNESYQMVYRVSTGEEEQENLSWTAYLNEERTTECSKNILEDGSVSFLGTDGKEICRILGNKIEVIGESATKLIYLTAKNSIDLTGNCRLEIKVTNINENVAWTPDLRYQIHSADSFADMQVNEISWSQCTEAQRYEIFRSERKDGSYLKLGEVENDVCVYQDKVSVEQWNATYYYKVKAIFSDDTYLGSDVVTVIGENAIDMTQATVEKAGTNNVISWMKMAGADGYVIERKMSGEDTFSELTRITGNDILTYTDVLEGTEGAVEYRIRAHKNETLYSEWSEILTAPGVNIESIEMEFGDSLVHPGEKRPYKIYKIIDGERYEYTGEVAWNASNGSGLVYDVSEEGNAIKVTGSDGKEILRMDNGQMEIIGESIDGEVTLTFNAGRYKGETVLSIIKPETDTKTAILEYWLVGEPEKLTLTDVVEEHLQEKDGEYTYSLKEFKVRECELNAESADNEKKLKVYGLRAYANIQNITAGTKVSKCYQLEEIPAEDLLFVSSAPNVAEITTDGKIKALSEGEAFIYVYGKSAKENYGTYGVKVIGNSKKKEEACTIAKDVKLSAVKSKIYLEQFGHHSNSSALLEIKDKKGNKYAPELFSFSSADNSVCLVDASGKVTVNPAYASTKNKTVKITATLKNDSAKRKVNFNITVYGLQQTADLEIYYQKEVTTQTALAFKKGEKITLEVKAFGSNEEEIKNPKVTWKVSNGTVASVKANKDGTAVVTMKKAGQCNIICTSADSFKTTQTLLLKAVDITPVLNKKTVKIESKSTAEEGYKTSENFTLTSVYGAVYAEPEIANVSLGKETLDKGQFKVVKNGENTYCLKVKQETLDTVKNNSKVKVTFKAKVLSLKENLNFESAEFGLQLQIITKEPKVVVKEAGTINRYYTSKENNRSLLTINTAATVLDVQVADTPDNKEFASNFEVIKEDGKWYIECKNLEGYIKDSIKGKLSITLDGYEAMVYTLTVKTPCKEPKVIQKSIPVISMASENLALEAKIQLIHQKTKASMKYFEIVEVDKDSKADVFSVGEGYILMRLKKDENYKDNENVITKIKVRETDGKGNVIWRSPIEITIKTKVSAKQPTIAFKQSTIILNQQAASEQESVQLGLNQQNVSLNNISKWEIREYNQGTGVYDKKVDWLEFSYGKQTNIFALKLKGKSHEAGTHKIRIMNLLDGMNEVTADLNVKIVDIVPAIAVKMSGKLDITNKTACNLTGKLTMKNTVAKEIITAEVLDDNRYSAKVLENGNIAISVTKEGMPENAIKAEKHNLKLRLTLPGGKQIETTTTIKPVCTVPKIKVPSVKTLYKSVLDQKVTYNLSEKLAKGVEITQIEKVDIPSQFQVETDGENVKISLKEKGLKAGTYKLKVKVTFKDAPQKPQVTTLKVKIEE